ncbi:transglycosylase SLT domain-containing protein [Nocardia spumae]|uniref:transglycosylase SLT domain-containing protein n=1 Tax=Nocardia spumae TaxID=2887190 RepID=UPI001D1397B9|nr:transglycosylase SLT domain-containing protein [Nocardia spumae]
MAESVSLPRVAEAPLLNSAVARLETVLQGLLNGLGDGSAQKMVMAALADSKKPTEEITGAMVTDYEDRQRKIKQYNEEWNSLDTYMSDIAENSAGVSKETRAAITQLVTDIKAILSDIAPHPSVALQLSLIDKIDKAVEQADIVVSQAHKLHDENSSKIPSLSTGGGSGDYGPVPSTYVPPNSSGSYDRQYTQPVSSTGGGPGQHLNDQQLEYYIGKALDRLGITDPAARARWTEGYLTLIKRESSGNTGSINLEDSNADAGHPSQGLTQTIPSTFEAYHVAGTSSNITDPEANIAASMNYVMDRYHVSRDGSNLTANVQQADAGRPAKGY